MVGRLDDQDLARRRFDAEVRKQARVEALGTGRVEDHLDAADADQAGIADRNDAFTEKLLRLPDIADDLDLGLYWITRFGGQT